METSILPIILLLAVSYLIGSLNAGKLLTNTLKKGRDISSVGTKNAGAWNVWMQFGRGYGLLVFGFDAAKGAGVVFGTKAWGFSEIDAFAAFIAVIIGHNWPIFFRFRGGKGFATLIGSVLAFNPLGALIAYGSAMIFVLGRMSGLAPFILLGIFVFLQQRETETSLFFLSAGIILASIFIAKRVQAEWQDIKLASSKFAAFRNLLLFDRVETRKAPSLDEFLFRKKKKAKEGRALPKPLAKEGD